MFSNQYFGTISNNKIKRFTGIWAILQDRQIFFLFKFQRSVEFTLAIFHYEILESYLAQIR